MPSDVPGPIHTYRPPNILLTDSSRMFENSRTLSSIDRNNLTNLSDRTTCIALTVSTSGLNLSVQMLFGGAWRFQT